jgi:protein TonB
MRQHSSSLQSPSQPLAAAGALSLGAYGPRPTTRLTRLAVVAGLHVLAVAALLNSMKINVGPAPASTTVTVHQPPPLIEPIPMDPPEPSTVQPQPMPTVLMPDVVLEQPNETITVRHAPTLPADPPTTGRTSAEATEAPPAPPKPVVADSAPMRTAVLADANSCARPEYPARSARNGDTGTVILALLVGVDGRVTQARVQQSSGHRELDRAAMAALSLCQFKPATRNGVAEAGWGRIAYAWTLE